MGCNSGPKMQYQLEMEQVFLSVRLFYCATIIDLNNNGTLKLQSPVLVEYSKYDLVFHFLIYHLDIERIDNIQNVENIPSKQPNAP